MIDRKKKKFLFNVFGVAIVTLWLIMMGLLVKKYHFRIQKEGIEPGQLKESIDSPQRDWAEIYLKNKKVGYAVNLIKPFGDGYFIQEEMFLKLNLMGLATGVYTATRCRVDDQFLLKSFMFNMTSGAVGFNISGKVEGDELLIETGKGEDRRTQRIRLSNRPMIGAGMGHFFKSRNITVGDTFNLPVFDPYTMAQKPVVVKVVAKEPIEIKGITYNAFRLETEMWGKRMTFWLDESGTTLKEQGFMGLTIIKSSAASAPRNIEGQGEMDFYEMAAVEVERELPDSDRSTYLKLQVGGMDHATLDPDVLNGGRQRFREGVMEITREKKPFKASYLLPFEDHADKMKNLLEPEFNIESDHEEIKNKALEIAGNDRNPASVARELLGWVYHNLEKKPVVAIPSAIEVLRTRVGDCNEHATLLTALLRASKIPARLSTGLVYARHKFFYHAWTEAYIGEWISMDATLNQMPADATHIKLVEGNLDKQVEIAGLMGALKLKVLDYQYD